MVNHQNPIDNIDVRLRLLEDAVEAESEVRSVGRTGVEMEALTAVSVALLAVYDMCKGRDKTITIESVRLLYKSGGKSGTFRAKDQAGP